MGRIVMALALSAALAGRASAKCGPVLIRISGEAKTHSANRQVLITVTPDPKSVTPSIFVEGDKFEADVYYDPFKSYSKVFGYNCTKKPDLVIVALLENGKEVDKAELVFSKDFKADGDGGYVLKSKLKLGK